MRDINPRMLRARTFLNEYRVATGLDGNGKLLGDMIPGAEMPIVRMTAPQVTRFRNNYWLLLQFAALACKCSVEDLTPLHLMAPFLAAATADDTDEFPQYLDETVIPKHP